MFSVLGLCGPSLRVLPSSWDLDTPPILAPIAPRQEVARHLVTSVPRQAPSQEVARRLGTSEPSQEVGGSGTS